MLSEDKITYFGLTDFRNKKTKFGIKNKDRSRHVYVIGKTGMGKSTLLENMAAQDIISGEGMCFVDPHGSAIDNLLDYIPENRITDVIYFAPFDTDFPISFNVLEDVQADQRHLIMSGLMASFKKIWPDSFSARMEYILSNTLLALLEYPGSTLLGVNRMLAEKGYRDEVVKNITDSSVKAFWIDEYNKWDPRYAREAGAAIQNKIGQFTSNPVIRNIIGQEKTSFNLREIMDNKKILLVNLSKGRIGESNANLLGGMLITKLYIAAMSRANVGPSGIKKLPPFFFFVDEFQNFANESFADILSEARKYNLNLTIAHQYIDQMQEDVASAVFGNVGTMITFRVGATDAEVFEKQFSPVFTAEDIVNLGKYQIYLSLMIDGIGSRPFSASTLPPIEIQPISMRDHVIANSRYCYAQEKYLVEERIKKWYEPINKNKIKKIKLNNNKGKNNKANNTIKKDKITKNSKNIQEISSTLNTTSDNKNVELEMKEVVSSKLINLIENISSKSDNNKYKEKEQKKKKIIRGVTKDTKSSLSSVLNKIIKDKKKNKEDNKEDKKIPVLTKKENIKTKNNLEAHKNNNINEIPEDVLKKILE